MGLFGYELVYPNWASCFCCYSRFSTAPRPGRDGVSYCYASKDTVPEVMWRGRRCGCDGGSDQPIADYGFWAWPKGTGRPDARGRPDHLPPLPGQRLGTWDQTHLPAQYGSPEAHTDKLIINYHGGAYILLGGIDQSIVATQLVQVPPPASPPPPSSASPPSPPTPSPPATPATDPASPPTGHRLRRPHARLQAGARDAVGASWACIGRFSQLASAEPRLPLGCRGSKALDTDVYNPQDDDSPLAVARYVLKEACYTWEGDKIVGKRYGPENVFVTGDSAGGNLTLSTLSSVGGIGSDDDKKLSWPQYLEAMEEAVARGLLSLSRVDDAVGRILRVKARLGLLHEPLSATSVSPADEARACEHMRMHPYSTTCWRMLARAPSLSSTMYRKHIP